MNKMDGVLACICVLLFLAVSFVGVHKINKLQAENRELKASLNIVPPCEWIDQALINKWKKVYDPCYAKISGNFDTLTIIYVRTR